MIGFRTWKKQKVPFGFLTPLEVLKRVLNLRNRKFINFYLDLATRKIFWFFFHDKKNILQSRKNIFLRILKNLDLRKNQLQNQNFQKSKNLEANLKKQKVPFGFLTPLEVLKRVLNLRNRKFINFYLDLATRKKIWLFFFMTIFF